MQEPLRFNDVPEVQGYTPAFVKQDKDLYIPTSSRVRMGTPSYLDLGPSILESYKKTEQHPFMREKGRDFIDRTLDFFGGLNPLVNVVDASLGRATGKYQTAEGEQLLNKISKPFRYYAGIQAEAFADGLSGTLRQSQLNDPSILKNQTLEVPYGGIWGKGIIDINFDWQHNVPLWKELKEQVDPMYWDDLLAARSEFDARTLVEGIQTSQDYQAAWQMWYENFAQDTVAEAFLTYPQITRFTSDLVTGFADPITWGGIGASVKVSKALSSYLHTMKAAKWTTDASRRSWAAWGAATTAEVGIGLAGMHLMALRDGTTENSDQYISAALFAGILGGGANAFLRHQGVAARIHRMNRLNDEVTLRQEIQNNIEAEFPGMSAIEVIRLRETNPAAYQAAMDEIATDTIIRRSQDMRTKIDPLTDPERFEELLRAEIQRKNAILDRHATVEDELMFSLGATAVVNDINLSHMENVGIASILDDVGVPTTIGADDVVASTNQATPKVVPDTQLAPDADEVLGSTLRYLLQHAEMMSPAGSKLRQTILRITEGNPNILSLADVRMLAKEAPEVLAELDLPRLMERVANRQKANQQLVKAQKEQKRIALKAEQANVERRAMPSQVNQVGMNRDGEVGKIIAVSPSGRTVTFEKTLRADQAARRTGQMPRPDVRKLKEEVASAEKALESKDLTPQAKTQLKNIEVQRLAAVSKVGKKINTAQTKLASIDSKITLAEGKLEGAEQTLAKFEVDEATRQAGGLEPRAKQLAAKQERVTLAQTSLDKLRTQRESLRGVLDDLAVEQQAATDLDVEVILTDAKTKAKSKTTLAKQSQEIVDEAVAIRKQELKELQEALEIAEESERIIQQELRTPEPAPTSRRTERRQRRTGKTEQPEELGTVDEYEVSTEKSTNIEVLRADQLAVFSIDDPIGQTLFPSSSTFDIGETAATNVYRGINTESKSRVPIQYHSMANGYRVNLQRQYNRGPRGGMQTTGWVVTLDDIDGYSFSVKLKAKTVTEAKAEIAQVARSRRAESMLDPARAQRLIGANQVALDLDLHRGRGGVIEEALAGIIPKEFDEVYKHGRRSLYDVEFIGHGVDSNIADVTGLSPAWSDTVNLRRAKFKKLVNEEVAVKQKEADAGVKVDADDAPLTPDEIMAELAETNKAKGAAYLRWLGMFGIRGSMLASQFNELATAALDALGGAGLALKKADGSGDWATSGTGAGTIGSGGIVPNRRRILYEKLSPFVTKLEMQLKEYTAVVGKGSANHKDDFNRAIYRYKTEGVLPEGKSSAQIIKEASDTVSEMGFPAKSYTEDGRFEGLVDELINLKENPNYVMRVRNKQKFKQIAADMIGGRVWDEQTQSWSEPFSSGQDFIEMHFEKMILEGNPQLKSSARFMSKRMVALYMSDSEHALRALDDVHGMKYKDAKEFVDAFEEVLREHDRLAAKSGGVFKTDPEKLNDFADPDTGKAAKREFLDALRKDLGQVQQKIKVTMPRLKLGQTKMKVKFRNGRVRDDLGQIDYFEHDMVSLSARYQTEIIARAGMRHFLKQRSTDKWSPQTFKEYRGVMERAFDAHQAGKVSYFESKNTLGKQLDYLENALMARPQYSRIGGVGQMLQTLSNLTTLRALPGFVPAQAPEMGSATFANGYTKVIRRIPALGQLVDDAAMGRLSYENAGEYVNVGLGMGWNENRIPSMFSSIDQVENASPIARKVAGETYPVQMAGKVNEWTMDQIPKVSRWGMFAGAQNMSDVVSAQELHNVLTQIARTADPVKRAARLQKFAGRKDVRLAQFGISRKDFEEIIEALRQDGAISVEKVNGVEFTNLSFDNMPKGVQGKVDDLFRSWISYYVQRSDDHSLPMFAATSELGKITQQFRQFSWGSNFNHLGRSMQALDQRALTSAVNQIVFGAITHVGLGLMRFHNDPQRLREYMSIENVVKGIMMRAAFFGQAVDVIDTALYALPGQETYFSYSGTPMSMSVPALQTVGDLAKGAGAMYNTAFGDGLTDRNFARMKRLAAPFDKFLPLELLWPYLEEGLGVR